MIKTFRGLLADGDIETIRLGTNNGLTGYRIRKFQLMANKPGASDYEFVCQVWTQPQATASGEVDFSNQALLAACIIEDFDTPAYIATSGQVIFESEIFNQDIHVTMKDVNVGESCNYYLELEQVTLDIGEAAVATLKDMRGSN
jgi:hypothetical protein